MFLSLNDVKAAIRWMQQRPLQDDQTLHAVLDDRASLQLEPGAARDCLATAVAHSRPFARQKVLVEPIGIEPMTS